MGNLQAEPFTHPDQRTGISKNNYILKAQIYDQYETLVEIKLDRSKTQITKGKTFRFLYKDSASGDTINFTAVKQQRYSGQLAIGLHHHPFNILEGVGLLDCTIFM